MKLITRTLSTFAALLILQLIGLSAQATTLDEECEVSTDVRDLLPNSPLVTEKKLASDFGIYSARIDKDNILMAKFSQCSLGLEANFIISKELNVEELKESVLFLLQAVIASNKSFIKIALQVKTATRSQLEAGITFEGQNDAHFIKVSSSPSPFFIHQIGYSWQPPEY